MTSLVSSIDEVKLYHRGATVTRVAWVAPADGLLPAQVLLTGLPLALEEDTLRVSLQAPEGCEVTVAQLQVGLHAALPEAVPADDLTGQLREAQRALQRLQARKEQLSLERDLLQQLPVPTRPNGEPGKAPPPSPLGARVALEQFSYDAAAARQEELRALRDQLREAREREAALREALRRAADAARVQPGDLTRSVTITLDCKGVFTEPVALRLSYFVDGASWTPQYRCAVDRGEEAATITMRALVHQRSGEDWGRARLVLSTASPSAWVELPRLKARRIGRAQAAAAEPSGLRPPQDSARALFVDYLQGRARAASLVPAAAAWARRTGALVELEGLEAARWNAMSLLEARAVDHGDEGYDDMDREVYGARQEVTASALMDMPRMGAGGMAPAPAASAPASRARAADASKSARRSKMMREEVEEDELLSEPSPLAPAAPSRFGGLVLADPDSPLRGALVPRDRAARDEASLTALLGAEAWRHLDLAALIEGARRAAAAPCALPEGLWAPREAAGRFDYAWQTAARVDVPSDGGWHTVPVDTREAACTLEYVVVPRVEPQVYRVARLQNLHQAPMLPGPAEVYVDGEYVLTTALPVVAPREHFKLGLGVEQAIQCSRNARYEERRSNDSVVATAEHWHEIRVALTNRLPRAIQCEVRERIPQPAPNAEVVIEERLVEPAWEPWKQRREGQPLLGGRRWRLRLEPGEQAELRAEYLIKVYSKNDIVGGNRREA
jgi:hypothetical protein